MDTEFLVQSSLFAMPAKPTIRKKTDSTFVDNMKLPVHRWYRYSAGFSAQWVASVIAEAAGPEKPDVFDPFAGSGTTLIAAEASNVNSIGVEAHPFVARVARAKLQYRSDPEEFSGFIRRMVAIARELEGSPDGYPVLIRKCYEDSALSSLDSMRKAWISLADGSPQSELAWLALASILRATSHVGTAPWQYVLPAKSKRSVKDPVFAFDTVVQLMMNDMRSSSPGRSVSSRLIGGDARTCEGIEDGFANLVVTSPPYPNNYDYADATRLEMSFFGEVNGWGDLQEAVRKYLVRSCSQHLPEKSVRLEDLLDVAELAPIRDEISKVCKELAVVRLEHGGRKTYHLMVAAYFVDLAQTWFALRRVCRTPSKVCFVIGDSAPYGVYVPVVDWLGRLALAAGFSEFTFEKTRDRNVKWKNRKHRVPLCEGLLWVTG